MKVLEEHVRHWAADALASEANVSRTERQRDVYLSTLAQYVSALGGALKVSAVFGDEEVEIGIAAGTVRNRR